MGSAEMEKSLMLDGDDAAVLGTVIRAYKNRRSLPISSGQIMPVRRPFGGPVGFLTTSPSRGRLIDDLGAGGPSRGEIGGLAGGLFFFCFLLSLFGRLGSGNGG